jgi:hypothetical protein
MSWSDVFEMSLRLPMKLDRSPNNMLPCITFTPPDKLIPTQFGFVIPYLCICEQLPNIILLFQLDVMVLNPFGIGSVIIAMHDEQQSTHSFMFDWLSSFIIGFNDRNVAM